MDGAGWEWIQTLAPTIEPLSLAEAKAQLRIAHGDDDGLIGSYIGAVRQAAEDYLARGLLTQTWKLTGPAFADQMWLPMAAPLQSVSSVKYYDTAGVLQTLATTVYTVDTVSRPGRVVRAPLQTWPTVQSDRLSNPVEITYLVGWDAKEKIPERIRQGCRAYLGYLENRDDMNARAAAESCWADRVFWKPPTCADAGAT